MSRVRVSRRRALLHRVWSLLRWRPEHNCAARREIDRLGRWLLENTPGPQVDESAVDTAIRLLSGRSAVDRLADLGE